MAARTSKPARSRLAGKAAWLSYPINSLRSNCNTRRWTGGHDTCRHQYLSGDSPQAEKERGLQSFSDPKCLFSFHVRFLLAFHRGDFAKKRARDLFREFLIDTLPTIRIFGLPTDAYQRLADASQKFVLDFDDAYQHAIAKQFNLKIATMDQDFKRIDDVDIIFL